MGGIGTGLGGPVVALPIDQVRRRLIGHVLPPHVAVVGEGHVGEDRVLGQRLHGVVVGLVGGARRHAEKARLGVCLLYTSDAADERSSVDLGGRRIIKKKKKQRQQ